VRLDWIAAEEENQQRLQVKKMVEQYDIVMSDSDGTQ
jgi:hypothetical protein